MADLQGPPGELRMTVSITRKATGKVETYQLSARATPEEFEAIKRDVGAGVLNIKETDDGRNP
jgi:hypothetical protein